MRTATLTRQPSTPEGTFGRLTLPPVGDGGLAHNLHSLELPWVDANGDGLGDSMRSCIAPGSYQCIWQHSPKYGWCYEVSGVVGRSRILIHPANFAGDTEAGWQSQLLGCIALGRNAGTMRNVHGKPQRCVTDSRAAVNALNQWGGKEPFTLVITAAPTERQHD